MVELDIYILVFIVGVVLLVEDVMFVEVDFFENFGLYIYFIWFIVEDGMFILVEKQYLYVLCYEVCLEFLFNGLEFGIYEFQVIVDDYDQNMINVVVMVYL